MALIKGTIGPGPGSMSQARILIADGDQSHRDSLHAAFAASGCHHIHTFDTLQSLRAAMAEETCCSPDLLLIDEALSDQLGSFMDAVRHGRIGMNPFVVMIVTTDNTDARHITGLVRQGADDVIVKPIASRTLLERIEYVAVHRRPFIVTSNYVGPDRRIDADRPSMIAQFEVPNTLLQHLTGDHGSNVGAQASIRSTVEAIVNARLEQHAQSLGVLSHLLLEAHYSKPEQGIDPRLPPRALFNVMLSLMRDIQRIASQLDNIALIELSRTLRQHLQMLARRHGHLNDQDVMLLKDLGEAVKMTMGLVMLPNPDIASLAGTYKRHGEKPLPPQGPIKLPPGDE